jgi:DNA-binding response OmpR family regulator
MHKDNRSEDEVYDDGYLRVEYASYYVACGGQPIYNLSRVEMLLFFPMVRNFERPVSYEALWTAVWGNAPLNMHTLRERVSKLRLKLLP